MNQFLNLVWQLPWNWDTNLNDLIKLHTRCVFSCPVLLVGHHSSFHGSYNGYSESQGFLRVTMGSQGIHSCTGSWNILWKIWLRYHVIENNSTSTVNWVLPFFLFIAFKTSNWDHHCFSHPAPGFRPPTNTLHSYLSLASTLTMLSHSFRVDDVVTETMLVNYKQKNRGWQIYLPFNSGRPWLSKLSEAMRDALQYMSLARICCRWVSPQWRSEASRALCRTVRWLPKDTWRPVGKSFKIWVNWWNV